MTRLDLLPSLAVAAVVWPSAGAHAADLVNISGPTYGTRIVADSCYDDQYAGSKVADGRLTQGDGCWFSHDQTPLPCALTFELAQVEDLRAIVLYQAAWQGNMYHTKDFAVEASADGQTWRHVAQGQLPDESLAKVELPLADAKTRRLRVIILTSYNSFQTCGLAEVELLAAGHPAVGPATVTLDGEAAPPPSASVCGFSVLARAAGPQAALVRHPSAFLAAVGPGEEARLTVEVKSLAFPATISAEARLSDGHDAEATITLGPATSTERLTGSPVTLSATAATGGETALVTLSTRGTGGEALVRWSQLRLQSGDRTFLLPLAPAPAPPTSGAPPTLPALRPAMERALIEWDWRMQDGIDTERNPSTYAAAIEQLLARGGELLRDLRAAGASLAEERGEWQALAQEWQTAPNQADPAAADGIWRRLHQLRRRIALRNPLADCGPLLFVKQVPGCFSHQLTQYYGRYARPGGGVFVLEQPGRSMRCRQLAAGALPEGSTQHPEVAYEGDRILFSYCQTDSTPKDTIQGEHGRYYHLYEMRADGSGLKQLTDGAFDDFAPRYLPDGKLVFISTRRLGWHRCGNPGCENYTLTIANADGSGPRTLSFHETQEWDPAVLNDGRVIYTRWDYVDRHPVFYEQLWSVLPDGSNPATFYGNNTFDPVGIWEARPVPGSKRVMGTAAAHHAMTAGSIILVDVAAGVDGPDPITRLTPDAPFPESEAPLAPCWNAGVCPPRPTPESQRWPGHCYRSPYPLSEKYFLAAYSFDPLIGEPTGNPPNMFGLYLVDSFGNKELLYRDLNIASLWPTPLRPRPRPPAIASSLDAHAQREGVFVLQNVYDAAPGLAGESVKRLRVLQVLPKSTPGIDRPAVGLPSGAPGKQVLGTVPVEADGSACFRAPADIPLAFQALDERGLAVQVMRSLTYLQPGETVACVGCHEPRTDAPRPQGLRALARPPSVIEPAPEGAKPFSYPRLVQPVLDQHCVSCHSGDQPAGGVALTGQPQGHYTASYNVLAPRVPYSDQGNREPLSQPGRYGARGSAVMKLLLTGHADVKLNASEIERLATWMDADALFYGTFDPEDQARQQRGELIAGPKLE